MSTSLPRALVALIALAFVLVACSSGSGSVWTPPPEGSSEPSEAPVETAAPAETEAPTETAAPAETEAPAATDAPAQSEAPAETAAPAEPSPPPQASARVIELQADSALRFTDMTGQPVTDIPVTPGESIIFRIDNTAGFEHNFYIGTDAELSVPSGTTDVGIATWTNGVEELEWVVPDDISELKYGCTVPGHYFTMQGTFSLADATQPVEPAGDVETTETTEAAHAEMPSEPLESTMVPEPTDTADAPQPAEPATAADGEARVIELEADAAIRFLQDGEQIREIAVTPGETVIFRVDNTAGFVHNLYIGTDAELSVPSGTTDVGIPDWETGVQELEWVVPEDLTGIRFACTVPGHYFTMQGDFVVAP